jgi:hypothetical protein
VLVLIVVHIIRSIAGGLRESSDILTHHHLSLFQVLKLLLELHNTLRHMVGVESGLKF